MREFVVAHLPESQGVDRPAAVEVSGSRLSQVRAPLSSSLSLRRDYSL